MKSSNLLNQESIKGLSRQAHIALTEGETERYTRDLNAMLDMVSVLDDLEPGTEHTGTQVRLSSLREDVPDLRTHTEASFSVPAVMEGI